MYKEKEHRILGIMLFQALFLGICVVLYEYWEWSHFDSTWESGLFYFCAAFVFQGACYSTYKVVFLKRLLRLSEEELEQKKMRHAKAQQTYFQQQMRLMNAMMQHDYIDPNTGEHELTMLTFDKKQMSQEQQFVPYEEA
jgi:hypothetical protein